MSITLETRIHPRYKTCQIVNFDYAHLEEDIEFPSVSHGCQLPSGPGFPYKLERPSLSFKTYRAMANAGLKHVADRVVRLKARSHITPDYIWSGVLRYGEKPPPRIKDPVYLQCLDSLREQVRCTLSVLSMEEAAMSIPQSTSPGLPYIRTHPGSKKGDVLAKHLKKFEKYWTRVGNKQKVTPLPDCAAFARSHISSPNVNKVRPVWAYPIEAVVEEARFAVPIIDALKGQVIGRNFAYGMELLKGGMTWLHHQLQRSRRRDPGAKFLMVDFTAFDSSVPAWLIRDVFEIIKEMFPDMTQHDSLRFKKVVDYFINTPIQNMDGRRFQKWHGVPSGSMFTNIVDTMVNFVVCRYAIIKTTGYDPLFFNCFGDDSIASLPGKALVNMACLADAAMAFGMKINVKKSYWTNVITNVHYLGYYNCYGDPVKPDDELIASLLYPQYLKDDWAYCIARALGCLLASCGNSGNVFLAAQSVYWAARNSNYIEEGLKLVKSNPRMLRHLSNMGCAEWNLSPEFFYRRDYSYPRLDCTKLLKGVM